MKKISYSPIFILFALLLHRVIAMMTILNLLPPQNFLIVNGIG